MKKQILQGSKASAAVGPPFERNPARPRRRLGVLLLILLVALVVLWYRQGVRRTSGSPATPPGPSELLDAGLALVQEQQWLAASEAVTAAMHAGVDSPGAHRTLGACLGQLGWTEDAIHEYQRAIRLEPSYLFAYTALANAYHSIGRRREGMETLARAEKQLAGDQRKDAASRYARPVAPELEALSESYATLGELPLALRWAQEAQTADPTRVSGYLLVGKCYLAMKRPDEAIAPLRRACALEKENADAHYTLALAMQEDGSPERIGEVLEHLTTAVTLNPRLAPALFQLGTLYLARQQWMDAHRAFMTAYQLQFEQAECLRRAGEACRQAGNRPCENELLGEYAAKRGDMPAALERYRRLAALPHYGLLANRRIAALQSENGKHTEAIAAVKKAIALQPKSGDLQRQLAAIYSRAQRPDDQIAALHQAIRLDPEHADADYYVLGQLAFDAGKYDEAERHLEECVRRKPDNSQYQYMLGKTYLTRPERGDRLKKAIAQLEAAQNLAPEQGYAHDFLSVAYTKAQRWPEAAITLHQAIDLAPDNELLYFRLGQAYQRLGRPVEARWVLGYYRRLRQYTVDKERLERRLRSRQNDAAVRAALADLLLTRREYAKARYQLEKSLEVRPNDRRAHELLAVIYGETGQPEAQQRHLRQAGGPAAKGVAR